MFYAYFHIIINLNKYNIEVMSHITYLVSTDNSVFERDNYMVTSNLH